MIAYKFVRDDGSGVFSGFHWPLPDDGPADWVEARVDPCRSGIHACRAQDLPFWAGRALFEVELDGEILVERRKLVSPRARLLRRIEAWDALREAYTRMCAGRAHELAGSVAPRLDGWEAVIEPSIPEGPALLGFVAARIAEEISGAEAYQAERERQAAWLRERLDLRA